MFGVGCILYMTKFANVITVINDGIFNLPQISSMMIAASVLRNQKYSTNIGFTLLVKQYVGSALKAFELPFI